MRRNSCDRFRDTCNECQPQVTVLECRAYEAKLTIREREIPLTRSDWGMKANQCCGESWFLMYSWMIFSGAPPQETINFCLPHKAFCSTQLWTQLQILFVSFYWFQIGECRKYTKVKSICSCFDNFGVLPPPFLFTRSLLRSISSCFFWCRNSTWTLNRRGIIESALKKWRMGQAAHPTLIAISSQLSAVSFRSNRLT